jgi:beta-lactamase superfamily II metal-dependent hydrolase
MGLLLRIIPAGDGDCFICEFDVDGDPFRLLIDGGTGPTFSAHLKSILNDPAFGVINLAIVTHIDDDHIAGMIQLLSDPIASTKIKNIWFNGYRHLPASTIKQKFSVPQGDALSKIIDKLNIPWNANFKNAVSLNDDGTPRVVPLGEGSSITILSPGEHELLRLKQKWETDLKTIAAKQVAKAAVKARQTYAPLNIEQLANPDLYEKDGSRTNASSIAFLLKVGDFRIFFGADALPEVICNAWAKAEYPPQKVDVFKVPHHGSSNNINDDLLKIFPATTYVISTSGVLHDHPSREAVARIIKNGTKPKLIFNFTNSLNSVWADPRVSNGRHTAQHGDGESIIEIWLQ